MKFVRRLTCCLVLALMQIVPGAAQQDSTLLILTPVESTLADSDSLAAPTNENPKQEISGTRVAIIGGTIAVAMGSIAIYQANGYWKNNRAPFHFREDLNYALHVDKIAHFWDTALLGVFFAKSFEWAGMHEDNAIWWGAGSSLLFNTYTEIQDGLSLWGFDRVDWLANVGGSAWIVGKHHWRALDPFELKWSYIPSKNLDKDGAFAGQRHLIFDDYEGFTFWLSVRVNDLLPKDAEPYWPDFLALGVGYGARDIINPHPYPVWYLSLDWDMKKIIPQDTWFLRSLTGLLNYIRFPAPAVRFSPGRPIWYGLYFGN